MCPATPRPFSRLSVESNYYFRTHSQHNRDFDWTGFPIGSCAGRSLDAMVGAVRYVDGARTSMFTTANSGARSVTGQRPTS